MRSSRVSLDEPVNLRVLRRPAPPGVVRFHDQALVGVLDDAVRTAAYIRGRQVGKGAGGRDRHVDDEVEEVGHRVDGHEAYGTLVDGRDLRTVEVAQVDTLGAEGAADRGVEYPPERRGHIGGGQHLPVVEGHVVTQLERPRARVVRHVPSLCECRLVNAGGIELDEGIVDRLDDALCGEPIAHDVRVADTDGGLDDGENAVICGSGVRGRGACAQRQGGQYEGSGRSAAGKARHSKADPGGVMRPIIMLLLEDRT